MRRVVALAVLWGGFLVASGVRVAWCGIQDELDTHLENQRRQVEDRSLNVAQRARVALEMASTLDRAAQSAPTAEKRRARWVQAIELLDGFNAREPKHPQKQEFEFQAAVYLWAQSQSWAQQAELAPADRAARTRAIELLDATIMRLRALVTSKESGGDALDHNCRFRLAQALADRAGLEPESSDARRRAVDEALALLESPIPEPGLQGFAHLLRADLLGRLGNFDKARAEVKKAAKLKPPPPAGALLQAQVAVSVGRKAFDEAIQTVERSEVDDAERELLVVRIRLAERADMPAGPERTEAEADAFRHANVLRKSGKPDAKLALIALAKAMDEPGSSQGPEAWDLLAEGYVALGDSDRAAVIEVKGAEKAQAQGSHEQAASLRNRAGAMLFQAGQFARAEALLAQVFNDRQAGALRPKAGMLRILALSRGIAAGQDGCTRDGLLDALAAQLREFPNDPTAGEARWLLGNVSLAAGDRDGAMALWKAIPHGDARWLDARLTVAQLLQDALDTQLLNEDRAAAKKRMDEVQRFLSVTRSETQEAPELVEIELARARLELTPGVGRPDDARELCDRLLKSSSTIKQRDRAVRLRIVAQAQMGRFIDAEHDTRADAESAAPLDLMEMARLLDQAAKATDSDLYRRRYGHLMRLVLMRVLARPETLPPAARIEARLRMTRAVLFSGNSDEARRLLANSDTSQTVPDSLLDDLADTYVRLDAYRIAIDIFRLRVQQTRPGSLPWFAARYGLALSYYRSGKTEDARRLIDATAILHPELGGGELRSKFEHLRQRIQRE